MAEENIEEGFENLTEPKIGNPDDVAEDEAATVLQNLHQSSAPWHSDVFGHWCRPIHGKCSSR